MYSTSECNSEYTSNVGCVFIGELKIFCPNMMKYLNISVETLSLITVQCV